jgi:penicillin-binding protein 1A
MSVSLWKRRPLFLALNALIILSLCLVTTFVVYYGGWAMAFDLDKVSRMPATSVIYDRNGYVIQRLFEEHRILVTGENIAPILKQAVIAKEDQRFHWHPGFDPIAIVRSGLINLFGGKVTTGASTITQQLARNSANMFQRTLDRKIKEIFLAIRIEAVFSKDEILTFYLNRIFMGGNLHGVGAASEAFFGKSAKDLTLAESALMAGIIAGPNSFSPWRNPGKAREVRALTLDRMAEEGFITKAQAAAAQKEPLLLRPRVELPGSYVTSAVQDSLPGFISNDLLFRGGLAIHTTIDINFQRTAEQQIETSLGQIEKTRGYPHPTRTAWLASDPGDAESPPYLQAAFVALNNRDGSILAVVGGRQFDESSYNRVINSRRQIGSTIKPFVYAHAFNTLNFTAFTEIDTSPFDLTRADVEASIEGPRPKWTTVRDALARSDNYAVMRTGLATGPESFGYFFSQCTGIQPNPFASVFLGTPELTPLQLASGYTAFANYGVIIEPFLIESISTDDGTLLYRHIDSRKRVLSPQVAFQIHDLLAGVVDEGTARALRTQFGLRGPLAGKTGTTNDYKDSWFVGYTTEVTAALWCGFDRPKPIMPGGYSSRIAVPTWAAIIAPSLKHYPPGEFVPPPGLQRAQMRREETTFFFFKKETIRGRPEWIRDDQRATALNRLDHTTPLQIIHNPENPSLLDRAVGWIWKPKPDDHFATTPTEDSGPPAVIQDNSETTAPRAVPVRP